MTMLESAIAAMQAAPSRRAWTIEELRLEAGVALRSRYRLANQLLADDRVEHLGGNCFACNACQVSP